MSKALERQLGFWETVRQNTHLKQFGTSQIAIVATIRGPLTVSLIKNALRLLFDQQPLLQARIIKKNDVYLFELDRQFDDIPFTVVERHTDNLWKKTIEHELSCPPPTDKYLWKAVFIHGQDRESNRHELLLFFHHAIADGVSACHAIKNLLNWCQQAMEGCQPSTSPLPMIAPVENTLKKHLTWDEYLLQLHNHHPIPQEDSWHYIQEEPLGQRVSTGYFIETSYHGLIARCRQEGVTINSALAAALICSGRKIQIHKGPISLLSLVDLRKYCEPPIAYDYLGCYVTSILTRHDIKKITPTTVWDLARTYQRTLYESIPKLGFTPYEFSPQQLENFSISNPIGSLAGTKNLKKEAGYSVDFCLTNKGLIDIPQHYGDIQIEKLYLCTSRQAGAIGCIVSVVSFPETMFINFGYAKPLLNQKIIKRLADELLQVLGLRGAC